MSVLKTLFCSQRYKRCLCRRQSDAGARVCHALLFISLCGNRELVSSSAVNSCPPFCLLAATLPLEPGHVRFNRNPATETVLG